jgi:hypothetical protein
MSGESQASPADWYRGTLESAPRARCLRFLRRRCILFADRYERVCAALENAPRYERWLVTFQHCGGQMCRDGCGQTANAGLNENVGRGLGRRRERLYFSRFRAISLQK